MKKDEEDRLRREIEDKKQQEMEEKRRRLAEVEQKRQAAEKAAKEKSQQQLGPNFKLGKKEGGGGADKVFTCNRFFPFFTTLMSFCSTTVLQRRIRP